MAFPCSPWSALQNLQKDKQAVNKKREEDVCFLKFAKEMAEEQQALGRWFAIENPAASQAWKHPVLEDWIENYDKVTFDMCTMGLKDPYTERPLKKRTALITNSEAIAAKFRDLHCCCGDVPHRLVMGNSYEPDGSGGWKRISLPAFAGGYTSKFARTLLQCVRDDAEAGTYPMTVFERQRQVHDMAETLPFLRGAKARRLNEAEAPEPQPVRQHIRQWRLKRRGRSRSASRFARKKEVAAESMDRPRPSCAPSLPRSDLPEPSSSPRALAPELGMPMEPAATPPPVPPPPQPAGQARRGRPRGSRNVATLEREQDAELAELARRTVMHHQMPSRPLQPTPQMTHETVEGWTREDLEPDMDWRGSFDEAMTLDPAVQIAGEEDKEVPERIRKKLALIPENVKAEVRRAHHTLGHPAADVLLRLVRNAKKSDDHQFYARHWKCPVCLRRQRPAAVPPAAEKTKVAEFNQLVGVDLKEVLDVTGERHTFLNVLDIATRYSELVHVESKNSQVVAQAFMDSWVKPFGVPERVIHDQGGELVLRPLQGGAPQDGRGALRYCHGSPLAERTCGATRSGPCGDRVSLRGCVSVGRRVGHEDGRHRRRCRQEPPT